MIISNDELGQSDHRQQTDYPSRSKPVYSHEPDTKVAALETWCREMVDTSTPIFLVMKTTQTVFNGSGTQEATDQLQKAFISPLMPPCQVCQSDSVWERFKTVVLEYEATR
ncbi:hypothetical protein R3P38DRAFT_3191862 [Favolaschia claudopus]|uniref:Uncharacterized protein n=1 Tax=Favolaschia claudopus TaxID=2862362 RepID=A0AAW0BIK9_9AGAR